MKKLLLTVLLFAFFITQAFDGMNIVATLPWIGSQAKEIGKDCPGKTESGCAYDRGETKHDPGCTQGRYHYV